MAQVIFRIGLGNSFAIEGLAGVQQCLVSNTARMLIRSNAPLSDISRCVNCPFGRDRPETIAANAAVGSVRAAMM